MPYSEAMSEYCAWVSPSGATARSTATRHFIDSRHTRKPGVAPSEPLLMVDTVHGYYVHGYYIQKVPKGMAARMTQWRRDALTQGLPPD
ncbi:hypothetical protein GCM10010303_11520 [Streptomyces purpurascens]|nr:hypothetical protein GCM10010303_11520 [Streptomyces purpurascens]